MIAIVPVVFIGWNDYLLHYLGLLLFLGLGLRLVLEKLRLVEWVEALGVNFISRIDKRSHEKRCREIDRKMRDKKYRDARHKNEKLPPNW
jgi:hypothetical protein